MADPGANLLNMLLQGAPAAPGGASLDATTVPIPEENLDEDNSQEDEEDEEPENEPGVLLRRTTEVVPGGQVEELNDCAEQNTLSGNTIAA